MPNDTFHIQRLPSVVYLTKKVVDNLRFRGLNCIDVFDYLKGGKYISSEDYVELLLLNDGRLIYKNKDLLPDGFGTTAFLNLLNRPVSLENGYTPEIQNLKERFANNRTMHPNGYSPTEFGFTADESDISTVIGNIIYEGDEQTPEKPFSLEHDRNFLFIMLEPGVNLLHTNFRKFLTQEVVRVFYLYQKIPDVSSNNWFKLYLEELDKTVTPNTLKSA